MGAKIPNYSIDDFLQEFADIYISKSFEIAARQISLGEFDKTLREHVSSQMKIPLELVLFLHHPFHWIFFTNHTNEPPFVLQQPIYSGEYIKVGLKKSYNQGEIDCYKDLVIKTYGDYLKARIKSFEQEKGINISHQQS